MTQRPAELDPTIVSQCNTLFAMRLANDRDQALLRSAVEDAAANLLSFVPSLGTGEAFVFGEGVAVPTRLQFAEPPARLESGVTAAPRAATDAESQDLIAAAIERWRGTMNRLGADVAMPDAESTAVASGEIDAERFSILRKAISLRMR